MLRNAVEVVAATSGMYVPNNTSPPVETHCNDGVEADTHAGRRASRIRAAIHLSISDEAHATDRAPILIGAGNSPLATAPYKDVFFKPTSA